jgi:hypothetical protein
METMRGLIVLGFMAALVASQGQPSDIEKEEPQEGN